MATEAESNTATEQTEDMDRIEVGTDGTTLPVVEVLTGRGFVTGKSGSGKSNTASVVAEELLEEGYPLLIVDTDGEYYGLKERYEMLHVGADEECDLRVGPEHAEKLAELALEQGVPIILDVSGYLNESDGSDLIRDTARNLFALGKKRKQPFLVIVEEIHEYVPEGGGMDETGKMLVKIAKRGRKHGLGICGVSQRPADVKKDFIAQANWVVWHRLTWDNDTSVVRRVIGSEAADAVPDLADGEGLLVADWDNADGYRRVQFRRKETFDAGATPGLEDFERPDLKSVSDALVDELSEITDRKEREQDRIAQLEATIEEKDERISELETDLERAQDVSSLAEQFTDALTTSSGAGGEELNAKITELREEKDETIRSLKRDKEGLADQLETLRDERDDLSERVDTLEERAQAAEHVDELREAVHRMADALNMDAGPDGKRLREKLERKDERISELENQVEQSAGEAVSVPSDYEEFIDDEVVRDAIADAKDETGRPRYVKAVIADILQRGGPATQREIAADIGIESHGHIGTAMKGLAEAGVVTISGSGGDREADFDVENVREIHERQARKERSEQLMETI